MKPIWFSLMAAVLAFAPITVSSAQDNDKPGADQQNQADDDDDNDGPAASPAEASVQDKAVEAASKMATMPANALSGDQLGLPAVTLTSVTLPPLVLGENGNDFAVSRNDYVLRAGQSYHFDIASAGGLEYKFQAPDFFRNIWIDEIVIDDLEVHMAGAPAWLEYDDKGTVSLHFKAVTPGRYDWHVGDAKGGKEMKGTITIVR